MSLSSVHRENSSCIIKRRSAEINARIFKLKFWVFIKETCYNFLVFLNRKGAGGIHNHAAAFESLFCAVKNIKLTFGTAFNVLLAPLSLCLLIFAEHSLAAARCVNKHSVKLICKAFAENIGVAVGNNSV